MSDQEKKTSQDSPQEQNVPQVNVPQVNVPQVNVPQKGQILPSLSSQDGTSSIVPSVASTSTRAKKIGFRKILKKRGSFGVTEKKVKSEKRLVLVIGGTGLMGGAVARGLLSYPWFCVLVATRRPWCAEAVLLKQAGAKIVEVDFNYKQSLLTAMRGVKWVFLHTSFWENYSCTMEIVHGRNTVDAAVEAGVDHLIYNGTNYVKPEQGRVCGFLRSKLEIEEYIRESGLAFTIVVMPFYFENFLTVFKPFEITPDFFAMSLAFTIVVMPFYFENFLTVFKPFEITPDFFAMTLPLENCLISCACLHDMALCICKIIQQGSMYIDHKVTLAAEMLSVHQMTANLTRGLSGLSFIDPELTVEDFMEFEFPGAKDIAAMFLFFQLCEDIPDFSVTRTLNPHTRTMAQWITDNKHQLYEVLDEPLFSEQRVLSNAYVRPQHLRRFQWRREQGEGEGEDNEIAVRCVPARIPSFMVGLGKEDGSQSNNHSNNSRDPFSNQPASVMPRELSQKTTRPSGRPSTTRSRLNGQFTAGRLLEVDLAAHQRQHRECRNAILPELSSGSLRQASDSQTTEQRSEGTEENHPTRQQGWGDGRRDKSSKTPQVSFQLCPKRPLELEEEEPQSLSQEARKRKQEKEEEKFPEPCTPSGEESEDRAGPGRLSVDVVMSESSESKAPPRQRESQPRLLQGLQASGPELKPSAPDFTTEVTKLPPQIQLKPSAPDFTTEVTKLPSGPELKPSAPDFTTEVTKLPPQIQKPVRKHRWSEPRPPVPRPPARSRGPYDHSNNGTSGVSDQEQYLSSMSTDFSLGGPSLLHRALAREGRSPKLHPDGTPAPQVGASFYEFDLEGPGYMGEGRACGLVEEDEQEVGLSDDMNGSYFDSDELDCYPRNCLLAVPPSVPFPVHRDTSKDKKVKTNLPSFSSLSDESVGDTSGSKDWGKWSMPSIAKGTAKPQAQQESRPNAFNKGSGWRWKGSSRKSSSRHLKEDVLGDRGSDPHSHHTQGAGSQHRTDRIPKTDHTTSFNWSPSFSSTLSASSTTVTPSTSSEERFLSNQKNSEASKHKERRKEANPWHPRDTLCKGGKLQSQVRFLKKKLQNDLVTFSFRPFRFFSSSSEGEPVDEVWRNRGGNKPRAAPSSAVSSSSYHSILFSNDEDDRPPKKHR